MYGILAWKTFVVFPSGRGSCVTRGRAAGTKLWPPVNAGLRGCRSPRDAAWSGSGKLATVSDGVSGSTYRGPSQEKPEENDVWQGYRLTRTITCFEIIH